MTIRNLILTVALLFLVACSSQPEKVGGDETLDVYFIDTEVGAATLIVTPAGESLLDL